MPEPPNRPRQPSHSELKPVLDQTPEDRVVDQRRFDRPQRTTLTDLPKAAPPERKPTLKGLSPPNPLEKKTWRLPTPPSALANARRTDPPASPAPPATGIRIPEDETPRDGRPGLAAELAKAKVEIAEFQRQERVRNESRGPGPYQPPLRSQSPVPSSVPSKTDAAIGKAVRTTATRLAERYGLMPLLLVFGIGGGITAIAKPGADPAKADAVLASQQAMRADVALLTEQVAGMLKREAARDQYTQCLESALDEVGEQLLPAQDRLANASPLRAYVKQRCARLRP